MKKAANFGDITKNFQPRRSYNPVYESDTDEEDANEVGSMGQDANLPVTSEAKEEIADVTKQTSDGAGLVETVVAKTEEAARLEEVQKAKEAARLEEVQKAKEADKEAKEIADKEAARLKAITDAKEASAEAGSDQTANEPVAKKVENAKTEEINDIFLQNLGLNTYKVLTPTEATQTADPSVVLHKMTRKDNKTCFTLVNGDEPKPAENNRVLSKLSSLNPFKGGKLKTKKRRVTKKRNQKKGFKSRSKK